MLWTVSSFLLLVKTNLLKIIKTRILLHTQTGVLLLHSISHFNPLSSLSSTPSHLDSRQDTVPVWCVCTLAGDSVLGLGRLKQFTLCISDHFKILSFIVFYSLNKLDEDASLLDCLIYCYQCYLRISFTSSSTVAILLIESKNAEMAIVI